jgi:hypothetical protein
VADALVDATVEVGYEVDTVTAAYLWDRARWDDGPPTGGRWGPVFDWTPIECDVTSGEVIRGASSAGGRYQSSTGRITARDLTGALAPWRVDAGVRRNRSNLPLRIGINRPGGPRVLFTGWVDTWDDVDSPDAPAATITITASDGLKYLARADTPERPAQGAGELAGSRFNRILDNAGWPWDRHIATGQVPLQATTMARPALEELWLTVDTEAGRMFVDRDGALVFWDRAAMAASGDALRWRFTDGTGGLPGICPAELVSLADDIDLANVVGIARAGGTAVWREDPASIDRHRGRRSWSRFDLIHQADAWSSTLADLQLGDRAALEFYISGIVLFPLRDPAAWQAVTDAELGDLCHVIRRRGGRVLDHRARITQLRHVFTATSYELVIGLGPPIRQALARWDETPDADTGWDRSRWSAA